MASTCFNMCPVAVCQASSWMARMPTIHRLKCNTYAAQRCSVHSTFQHALIVDARRRLESKCRRDSRNPEAHDGQVVRDGSIHLLTQELRACHALGQSCSAELRSTCCTLHHFPPAGATPCQEQAHYASMHVMDQDFLQNTTCPGPHTLQDLVRCSSLAGHASA